MKPIFLIGYMGSGKTTLGRALARHTGLRFIDLDSYIESRRHATVAQIFATEGQEGFRRIEAALLREVASFEDVIVACGGGTPCFHGNMEVMNASGTTVLLEVALPVLLSRLSAARAKRPLIASLTDDELETFVTAALKERAPWYEMAQHRFPASCLDSHEQVRRSVERFITLFPLTAPRQ